MFRIFLRTDEEVGVSSDCTEENGLLEHDELEQSEKAACPSKPLRRRGGWLMSMHSIRAIKILSSTQADASCQERPSIQTSLKG